MTRRLIESSPNFAPSVVRQPPGGSRPNSLLSSRWVHRFPDLQVRVPLDALALFASGRRERAPEYTR